jgi:hypothetical protein
MVTKLKIDMAALERVVSTDPRGDQLYKAAAEKINARARTIFLQSQRGDNEFRFSETTPPKYADSFRTRKLMRGRKAFWQAYNDDPASVWVEYGAHAGKAGTFVLGYKPYTKALGGMG